jgi:dUTP pyrophosphatase
VEPLRREVRVRVLPHAEGLALPSYGTPLSAGCDLRAAILEAVVLMPGERLVVPTGLCVALPPDCELQIRPRSGLAVRHGITVLNAPGTIDADYRGEIQVPLINLGQAPVTVYRGDRIAQAVLAPVLHLAWDRVDVLDETVRGESGFGSTGRT